METQGRAACILPAETYGERGMQTKNGSIYTRLGVTTLNRDLDLTLCGGCGVGSIEGQGNAVDKPFLFPPIECGCPIYFEDRSRTTTEKMSRPLGLQ